MPTSFINVPVPASGVGASVDVSTLGALKTLIVGGNFSLSIGGAIVVEGGINGQFAPIARFDRAQNIDVDSVVVQQIRAVVLGNLEGTASLDVGGELA